MAGRNATTRLPSRTLCAVTVPEEKFGMTKNAGAIVGYAVIQQNPIAVCYTGPDLPSLQRNSILRVDAEILFCRTGAGEHLLRVLKPHRIQTHGVKDAITD
jgi:hypothetical protein